MRMETPKTNLFQHQNTNEADSICMEETYDEDDELINFQESISEMLQLPDESDEETNFDNGAKENQYSYIQKMQKKYTF